MNTQTLFAKFSSAINWNAFLYLVYKFSSTILSLFLYKALSTSDFSSWANTQAFVFLALLWLDFGMRKSIPRYSPAFSKNKHAFVTFTRTVLLFQLFVLFVVTPILYFLIKGFLSLAVPSLYLKLATHYSSIFYTKHLLFLALGLFISEGLIAILRLMFYAHFLNKPFNLLSTTVLAGELTANILIISSMPSSYLILQGILATKIIAGVVLIIASMFMLNRLYNDIDYPGDEHIDTRATWKKFTEHSLIMWWYGVIKSVSERNFIIPVLTYTLGAELANIFKIGQDGALLFERAVVKTIGTSDTALLSHVEEGADKKMLGHSAFEKLTRKVASLCIPLFGVVLFVLIEGTAVVPSSLIFILFLIFTATYLLEVLLSPYERVLEVKREYWLLACAYIPYVVAMVVLYSVVSWIGLVKFVACMQGVRLVSSCVMVLLARVYYGVRFPWVFTLAVLGIVCGCVGILVVLVKIAGLYEYVTPVVSGIMRGGR